MTQLWFATSTEEYLPDEMLEHAVAAEQAGFDALGTSDHWAPWFPDGRGTQAWVYLGAVGQRTSKPIGSGVTPVVHHYHPGAIAQAWMTLEAMYPGRVWLRARSGESGHGGAPGRARASGSPSCRSGSTGRHPPSSSSASTRGSRRSRGCGTARR